MNTTTQPFFASDEVEHVLFGLSLSCFQPWAYSQTGYKFDAATVSGLPARNIGSATMSGRVAAVDAVEQDGRLTVFVGAASGGVWKSVNGGTTFKPVFDSRDRAVDRRRGHRSRRTRRTSGSAPARAWVRNSVSVGDGVYKSTDGGENWTNVGLKDYRAHRQDPRRSQERQHRLVCATGHLWDDNDERGVYKTTDGGKTWRKVLAGANGSTGCAMLALSRAGAEDDLCLACGTSGARRGPSARAARAAACSSPPTAATTGPRSTTANAKGLPAKP